jgi:putative ABC transport system ATP-binding protein
MNSNEIIRIENLRREFIVGNEVVKALRGVSFKICEGEFVSIMGASGSGKSSLLNILGCLDKPTSGKYYLDNVDIKTMSNDELAMYRNKKIGFVFQAYNLLPRTTALENVELPLLYNLDITNSERIKRAKEALDAVGLTDRFDHTPAQMSGGQQQRVAIARSLVNDPVIILADEATGNLDSKTSYEIMSLFQELNRNGKTIAFVTHEPDIASFCGRNIYLRDGIILKETTNEKIASAEEMLATLPVMDELEVTS